MALSSVDRESSTRRDKSAPDYLAYLQSPAWKTKRNRALRLAHWACHRCGGRRDLQVHHVTYERLYAEIDGDLEVLCQSCHNSHHREEQKPTESRIYSLLVSEVLGRDPFAKIADISAEVKDLCRARQIRLDIPAIDRAISLVCSTRLKDRERGNTAYVSAVDAPEDEPLTHAQTVEMLARIRAKLNLPTNPTPKPVPRARLVTRGRADQLRAFAMVTREMQDAIARCEALEQEPPCGI